MGERGESMNTKPSMFQAGISSKFTKRHVENFHDTTLMAASAAKQRAERKLEKQADAIDKQQKKIETEMKKIEEITLKLHRQQMREAKRLRNRLHYAATRIQGAFRRSQERWRTTQSLAVTRIQCRWRGVIARAYTQALIVAQQEERVNSASLVITRNLRVYACRFAREQLIIEREYAAILIQSVARMAFARKVVWGMLMERGEERLRNHAATMIQCNAKSYMTRLIYLDVLYVICRIQAVIRGFLIRRRLQWIAAIDIDGICKFQALARGFLTRQRLNQYWQRLRITESRGDQDARMKMDHFSVDSSTGRPSSVDDAQSHDHDSRTRRQSEKRIRFKAVAAAATVKPQLKAQIEGVIKRSYWLPAGASFNKRLPVLPGKRAAVLDLDDFDDGLNTVGSETNSRVSRTPKKRNQRNRPSRLAPVSPPLNSRGGKAPGGGLTLGRVQTEAETELQLVNQVLEDKLRREEELKHKLLCRKMLEKRRMEHEQRLKREQENEENERKLMEREEKLARLLLKVLHRRSKEVKIKRQSAEQQREERERIAMAREERQTRLLAKLAARQALMKKHQAAALSSVAAGTGSHNGTPSTGATVTAPARMRGSHSRSELHSKHTSGTKTINEGPQDDDDDDMSFLNIDFKIPEAMEKGNSKQTSKVGPVDDKKPRRKLSKLNNGGSSDKFKKSRPSISEIVGEGNQEELMLESLVPMTTRSTARNKTSALKAGMVENDFEFDYGSEFEEIIDEAKLGRLIC